MITVHVTNPLDGQYTHTFYPIRRGRWTRYGSLTANFWFDARSLRSAAIYLRRVWDKRENIRLEVT